MAIGNKYILDRAYLVYREEKGHNGYTGSGGFYFQEHPIVQGKEGSVSLGVGKPLSKEALITLCKQVVPTMSGALPFIDGNVLATSGMDHGPDVWFIPPATAPMFFTEKLNIPSGIAPWPGLVAVTTGGSLNLYAVKGDTRPGPDTELYVAPLFNMGGIDSSVCTGNSKTPEISNDYSGWEQVLFQSAFTHEGGEGRIKDGLLANLWENLVQLKMTSFPEKQLVPANKTVAQLLEQLRRGNGH